ncbi:MAG: uracil-DNA glycosylase [Clostridia bacterium]|nr:uracil-DNA glycosylase [Clostridia bacterium]MBR3144285.1 uracil-DNA glycosylase [Clostridia bacterium]
MVNIGNDWDEILKDEWQKPYYKNLRSFLKEEYRTKKIYPKAEDIFASLKNSSFADTRVVIIGQDPYHGENQAMGLCFSVKKGVPLPPSLKNIYKEMKEDVGVDNFSSGDLTPIAKQGVLLLNTTLTVREGAPKSHAGKGWEIFTDRVISEINKKETPVVFLLWGNDAKKKAKIIDNPIHFKYEAAHPSPLSVRGFLGCKHFSLCNETLIATGQKPINWEV